nr:hypothetical protein [Tanacetum cinerariifolium]
EYGLEVMETLRKSPSTALPVILICMKQKQEEWIKCREDFNKKDDDVLYSVDVGSRHSIVPHLEYDLTDKDIHEHLFKIINYLCEEVCSTKEQVNQVLKLWTTFLALMLYVPSRPENSDNVKDDEISTHGATRNEGESDGRLRADSVTLIMSNKENQLAMVMILFHQKEWIQARDKAPAVGVVNDNVLPKSSTELSGRDATPRLRNVHDHGHEAKSNIDDVPSSQQAKHSMEINADADDQNSKNEQEGGDDVSGYVSTADECSREDHEDGNRDDFDGKAESEREAEGIEDANFIATDGTYSDHILLSAKPLAKHVASPLHDGGKKDCNIFYGNESFYLLFRLHQVRLQFS